MSRRGERRRARLLEVAARRFMSDGYAATSINAIVEEAGGSLSTAYNLFGNKEGLLRAVIDETSRRLHADTFDAQLLSCPPEQALPELSMRIMATTVSPPLVSLRRLVIAEVVKMPGMSEVVLELLRRSLFDPIEHYLAEWDRRGVLRVPDPAVAARQFISLAKGRFEEECQLGFSCADDARRAQATHENVELFLCYYRR